VDGASAKAKQVSDSIGKATGMLKSSGQEVKTTVTPSTTVEEVRKADTFPTTSEEGVKAQTEPTVAASQQSMQARSSEIASENQKYTSDLQVWNNLLEKTTDPATKTFAQTRINLLNTNHESNLAQIENKYT
jgi:predicted amidohydrolase YtcJ